MLFRVVVVAVLVVMIGMAYGTAIADGRDQAMVPQPRITCDLLSFQLGGFSFGDSACAAHCLVLVERFGQVRSNHQAKPKLQCIM
ncbi:unnamed protein product [Rotaria magnacalcarata]|uniref:Defensin n=1 Tax=Rotaria magnacalcarata TaxID=392030 RepID=A0A816V2H0_9BILA|nr:unnamed protein product [Rotaria magnacalcarata]CAF2114873.1 unnamed protein product [Rotaria magnacalcarata]CAF5219772.1 unnamed protein product [Rotaria magnacalcarata]